MLIYILGIAFSLWMAVETVRRGQANPWLFIVLFFGPLGAGVYLLTQVAPQMGTMRLAGAQNNVNLRQLERDAERLDNLNSWTEYAHGLRSKRKVQDAVVAAHRAVEKGPHDTYALAELGYALISADRASEAQAPLAKLVEQEPFHDHGEAMYALALAQQKSGDLEDALVTARRLTESSSRPMFVYARARLEIAVGDKSAAREMLERLVRESRDLPRYAVRDAKPWVRRAKKTLKTL